MTPICALLDSGIQNENPDMSKNTVMSGDVAKRPGLSMILDQLSNQERNERPRISTPLPEASSKRDECGNKDCLTMTK